MHKIIRGVTILLAFTSQTHGADLISDRFSLNVDGFSVTRESGARLDAVLPGDGTPLNLERDLGLDTSGKVFRLDSVYRFSKKHRIDFTFFDLSRQSNAQITEREIQFGDQTFNINTQIDSSLDLYIFKTAYTWSFLIRDQVNLGVSFGLYTATAKAQISSSNRSGSLESESLIAPLPVIGLRGEYQIAPRWTLRGSSELFKLKIDNIEGRLFDVLVGVDFQVYKQISVGVGYNYADITIDSTNSDFTGALDWSYDGAMLYAKFGFGEL